MDPINYLGMLPQVDLGQKFLTGLQAGASLGEIQDQAAARQLALQQKQVAMQRAQQYQSDVSVALAAPMDQQPQLFSALALRNPEQYEAINKSFGALSAEQQKNELRSTYGVASALKSGRSDLALQQIDDLITAHKNSGQPTADLEGLRTQVQDKPELAYSQVLHLVSGLNGGKAILDNLQGVNEDARKGKESDVTVAGKQAENVQKNLGIIGQTLGSLQGKNAKPEQAKAAIASLVASGAIPKEQRADWLASVPTDPKELDAWLGQQRAAGMKPDEQMKYTTPDANTLANNATQVQTTGMNNRTQLAVQDRIDSRQDSGDDAASFSKEAIDNAAARYNIDGTLPPMGMGKAAAAGRTKILNRAAELKAGVDPEQQRRDQLTNKGDIASQNKTVREFTSGKLGASVRSFNVGLAHLDTLGQLADAMGNKDLQAVNRLGNYFATQTGAEAPVKFEAAKKVVTDEIVKAIVGAGGTGHDREEAAKTVSAASSPAQLRGVINTYKELMVGQLGGLDQQYRTGTGRDDFHKFLSPQAAALYGKHGGAPAAAGSVAVPAAAAPGIPTGWTVREH